MFLTFDMMESNSILELSGIDKHYGKVHAVKHLNFTLQKGKVYGLLGPNGSGKSTTLGIVLNVVNADSGTYRWFGGKLSGHEALKRVGALIERPNFYPYMTARQNLELVCRIKEVPFSRVDEMLDKVGLLERAGSKFKTFSLGMKQRLAIASALLNRPEILILDEPTNGLDPQGINEVRSIIRDISTDGTTILLASHLLDEVEKVCNHVIILRDGEKIFDGSTEQMQNNMPVIEIKTDQPVEVVKELLDKHPEVQSVEADTDVILVHPKSKSLTSGVLNRYLFEHSVTAQYLKTVKPSLEQQFLQITRE